MKSIIELAKEADIYVAHLNKPMTDKEVRLAFLKRFAALVAAHEREACAKVCEAEAVNVKWNDYIEGCEDCAAAIRARGEK